MVVAIKERCDLQFFISQKGREELLEDGVGNVLHLRTHADGLCSYIHGEDFSSPNPGRRSPRWFVEEYEEEEQEDDGDADGLGLDAPSESWGFETDEGNDQHAHCHPQCSDDEEKLSSKSIDGPDSIEGEEDSEGGVQSINESNSACVWEDLLVNLSGVGVQSPLASELLSDIQYECEQETLSHRAVLPESRI